MKRGFGNWSLSGIYYIITTTTILDSGRIGEGRRDCNSSIERNIDIL